MTGTVFNIVSLLSLICASEAYKVLFIPLPELSHIVLHGGVAEAMIKHGHQSDMIKPRSVEVPSQLKNRGIRFLPWDKKGRVNFLGTKEFENFVASFSTLSFLEIMAKMKNIVNSVCEDLLLNDILYETMKKQKYDFVVVDYIPNMHCFYAVPRSLKVPYGSLAVFVPPNMISTTLQTPYIVPNLPIFYTQEPSFIYRFVQFLALIILNNFVSFNKNDTLINKYIENNPVNSLYQLQMDTKIWLIDSDPMVTVARHHTPNMIEVGGLSAGPVSPLPKEMATFADSAKQGLIVISFGGSLTANFPQEQVDKLLKALGQVKYKVIMRLKNKPSFVVEKNIKLVDWLPQNDILGHKNTILFITHCGLSSITEATYHGVPMLGFPNQHEQQANIKRAQDKGFAEYLDRNTFTVEELTVLVKRMTEDKIYKDRIGKASAIMKSKRFTAREEAVYWIEHVIKYGNEHLIPYTAQLSWYQILMLDILALLIAIIAILVFILVKCFRCCARCCRGKKQKKQKKN